MSQIQQNPTSIEQVSKNIDSEQARRIFETCDQVLSLLYFVSPRGSSILFVYFRVEMPKSAWRSSEKWPTRKPAKMAKKRTRKPAKMAKKKQEHENQLKWQKHEQKKKTSWISVLDSLLWPRHCSPEGVTW